MEMAMAEYGSTSTTRRDGRRLRFDVRGLMLSACGVALCTAGAAQTLQLVPQTFPVTQLGQTTALGLTLNITSDVAYISPTVVVDGAEYAYTGVTGCAGGSYMAAGTVCTLNINFTPQLPGQAASPVPIARTGVLTIKYFDIVAGQTGNGIRYQSFLLSGSGTGPHAVLSPGVVSGVVGNDATPQVGFAGDGGPASAAVFNGPTAIAMDASGNIYIADTGNNVVRVVYAGGTIPNVPTPVVGNIYTIAGIAPSGGTSTAGAGQDYVVATQSPLNAPSGLALDGLGDIYIADTNNDAVRVVDATTGIITTVAGNMAIDCASLNCSFGSGDGGPATQATINGPTGIAVDGNGNVFIAEPANNAIREVTAATGIINTVAGNPTLVTTGNNGDGGPATLANLSAPGAVTVDSAGDLYISDSGSNAIRRVDAVTGNITTVAQTGTAPGGLSVDSADNVYFTVPASCTVSQWNPYYMATIPFAGSGSCTASGDGGLATGAGFHGAASVVIGGNGNAYVLEADGVRLVDGSKSTYAFGALHLGDVSPTLSTSISNTDIVYLANRYVSPWQLKFLSGNFFYGQYSLPTPFLLQPYTNANINEIDCNGPNAAFSLYPGESCGLAMNVQPTADGTVNENFVYYTTSYTPTSGGIYTNTPETIPVSVSVTGQATTATLTGGPLSFTAVVNEGASAPQALTLTNTGSSTLTISQIYTSNFDFQETDTCGIQASVGGPLNTSARLAAGASCQINVTFRAGNASAQNGTLYVVDDASSGGGTQTALLSGTTTYPIATLQPDTLNFASTPLNGSTVQSMQLTNTGSAPLNIASVTVTGNDPGPFEIVSNNCGSSLAVDGSCNINLKFIPYAYGYYSADVNVLDDSGGAQNIGYYVTQSTHLVGTTGTASPSIGVSAGNLSFPATAVGMTSTQTVTLSMGGAATLNQLSIAAGFPEFTIGGVTGCTVGSPVAAGTTCEVTVSFTPIGVGARTAPLTMTLGAANGANPYAFGLTGTATGVVAALTPGIISNWGGSGSGIGTGIYGADGPAIATDLGATSGMAMDASGTIYLADGNNDVIWRIDPGDYAHLYAGTPFTTGGYIEGSSGDGGTALGSHLGLGPGALALDARGGLYVAQGADNYSSPSRIRYIDPATNLITTAVGFVTPGTWGATTTFGYATRIAVPVNGTSYVFTALSSGNSGVVTPVWLTMLGATVQDGDIKWVNQGTYFGGPGCSAQTDPIGDGCTALQATVGGDAGMVIDAAGNLYFADTGSSVGSTNVPGSSHSLIRKVDASTHLVSVVAGTGTPGFSGDGGPATQAEVYATDMVLDSNGNLDFIDGGTRVRQINLSSGIIKTIAGNGAALTAYKDLCTAETGDGGSALAANFAVLTGIGIDAANNLYLSDNGACNIRRVDAASQIVNIIAGQNGNYLHLSSGNVGLQGSDGSALEASLAHPQYVKVDGFGNLFIGDGNGGVRKIDVSQSVLPFNGPFVGTSVQTLDTLSRPLTATLLNAGNAGPLSFTAPFNASAWGISDPSYIRDVNAPTGIPDCYTLGAINAGTECPISVDFGPMVVGSIPATLTVNDDAILSKQKILLTGIASGPSPSVTLLPFLLSFTAPRGSSSASQVLSLANSSTSALPIASVAIAGADASAFSQTNDCGTSLAPGTNCVIQVTFNPQLVTTKPLTAGVATYAAQVIVSDTAGNSPQVSSLTGTSTPPLPVPLNINETIHVSDGTPSLVPATPLNINETIHVSDGTPALALAQPLVINETIHVSDAVPPLAQSIPLNISETIHVSDAVATPSTPPVLTLPSSFTAEATNASGAVVTYTASAFDIVDGVVPVSCTPASGSTFPIATTTVNCTASDSRHNTSTGSFTVSVVDTTPPALTLPSNMTIAATSASGAIVTYTASAVDIVDGVVPVACTPASGSTFPLATTTVNCTASDSRHNTSTGSFTVSVVSTTPPINVFATGTLPQGTTSNVILITLTFNSSTTLGNLITSTLGAPGSDFTLVSSGTCQIGSQYTSGASCTVGVTFTPSGPGLIVGQLTATDTTGTVQATANLASVRYR